MIKHLTFSALLSLGLMTQLAASSLEEKYLATRDQYIERFRKLSGIQHKEDEHALDQLEGILRKILGPIKIEETQEPGNINLETLDPDWDIGFGQLDGLAFNSKKESVVVTTDTLLKNYLENHPDLPKDYRKLFMSGDFYSDVFVSDAAGIHYGEVPIKQDHSLTYSALGGFAQDIGPLVPNTIFVFAVRGDKIFLVSSSLSSELPQIPQCEQEWNRYFKKASEDNNYENLGFKAYCDCYRRLAKKEKFFESIVRQAQSIIDRLPQKTQ